MNYEIVEFCYTKLYPKLAGNGYEQSLVQVPELMEEIIEQELLPVVDYKYISYKILGVHLPKSTKDQRNKFVAAMKRNITRSYAAILHQYHGQQIVYPGQKPLKNKRLTTVPIQIIGQGKPPINLLFKLRKQKRSGDWLIFDVLAEGISMLATKQAEITKRIRKLGLEQVTIELQG